MTFFLASVYLQTCSRPGIPCFQCQQQALVSSGTLCHRIPTLARTTAAHVDEVCIGAGSTLQHQSGAARESTQLCKTPASTCPDLPGKWKSRKERDWKISAGVVATCSHVGGRHTAAQGSRSRADALQSAHRRNQVLLLL